MSRLAKARRWRIPIRTRLTVSISVVVALTMFIAFASSYLVIQAGLYGSLDNVLIRQSTQIKLAIKKGDDFRPSGQCQFLAAPACSQLIEADGSSDGALPVTADALAVAKGEHIATFENISIADYPGRAYISVLDDGTALQVALRSDAVESSLRDLQSILFLLSGLGILVSALAGYLVARSGLRPIDRLTAAAEKIAAERDLSYRINLAGSDELARLAAAFDTMLSELESSVIAQGQLVTDASHELRTPLTSIRTNADLLRGGRLTEQQRATVGVALSDGIEEMTALVSDVVDLARGDELPHQKEDVRLDLLVERRLGIAMRHWPDIRFEANLAPTIVYGVPQRLDRLVANLLDNGAKFSPAGGVVHVSVESDSRGVRLAVRDHGRGIPDVDLPHIFQRFYRSGATGALPGSGLGLAMALQIVRSHNGSIRAANAEGGGAILEVVFPVSTYAE